MSPSLPHIKFSKTPVGADLQARVNEPANFTQLLFFRLGSEVVQPVYRTSNLSITRTKRFSGNLFTI